MKYLNTCQNLYYHFINMIKFAAISKNIFAFFELLIEI